MGTANKSTLPQVLLKKNNRYGVNIKQQKRHSDFTFYSRPKHLQTEQLLQMSQKPTKKGANLVFSVYNFYPAPPGPAVSSCCCLTHVGHLRHFTAYGYCFLLAPRVIDLRLSSQTSLWEGGGVLLYGNPGDILKPPPPGRRGCRDPGIGKSPTEMTEGTKYQQNYLSVYSV